MVRLLKIKCLVLWGLTLSYSTGCLHFYHLLKCFVMKKTKAWICTAVTRIFRTSQKCKNASLISLFFVRNKTVKDKNRHEDDIPCLFCLCCLESNSDYSKKLCCESWWGSRDNHCLVSPYWMPWKLYDSARTTQSGINESCSCIQIKWLAYLSLTLTQLILTKVLSALLSSCCLHWLLI